MLVLEALGWVPRDPTPMGMKPQTVHILLLKAIQPGSQLRLCHWWVAWQTQEPKDGEALLDVLPGVVAALVGPFPLSDPWLEDPHLVPWDSVTSASDVNFLSALKEILPILPFRPFPAIPPWPKINKSPGYSAWKLPYWYTNSDSFQDKSLWI